MVAIRVFDQSLQIFFADHGLRGWGNASGVLVPGCFGVANPLPTDARHSIFLDELHPRGHTCMHDTGSLRAGLDEDWGRAVPWDTYLTREVEKNRELWQGVYRLAAAPPWWRAETSAMQGVRLLALSEDWCGDAANSLPVIARLAESLPGTELRVLRRDENLPLMDRFLTGGSRSIPIVLILGSGGEVLRRWGPRPAPLQDFVLREKAAGARPVSEIYRDVRTWYARDRGETIARELAQALSG